MPPPLLEILRARLHELSKTCIAAAHRHPNAWRGVVAAFAVAVTLSFVGGVWLLASVRRGLPDDDAVGRIGEMGGGTTVYDRADRLDVTIFKEPTRGVPRTELSP